MGEYIYIFFIDVYIIIRLQFLSGCNLVTVLQLIPIIQGCIFCSLLNGYCNICSNTKQREFEKKKTQNNILVVYEGDNILQI